MEIIKKFEYPKIERVEGATGRHYDVGGTRPLPSVTTILSATKPPEFTQALVDWRLRVGNAEADRITDSATFVGNQLHDNLEQHILHGSKPSGMMMSRLLTDLVITRGLCKVDEVWGVEVPIYSENLYAGTIDLIGVHEGDDTLMDFKNSRTEKRIEWIEDYFLQTTAYAQAHNEQYGTKIRKCVIMMAAWSGKYLEFIIEGKEFDKYLNLWYDRVYAYYEKHGI